MRVRAYRKEMMRVKDVTVLVLVAVMASFAASAPRPLYSEVIDGHSEYTHIYIYLVRFYRATLG